MSINIRLTGTQALAMEDVDSRNNVTANGKRQNEDGQAAAMVCYTVMTARSLSLKMI